MLRRLHTQYRRQKNQGCYLPLRSSTRTDLQASDGHWKGREYCEEPQRAIVAVAAGTREGARPYVRASAQTGGCDAPTQTMDLQDGCTSWWDADSPGLDGEEIHSRECSQQSWRSYVGYQPCQDWHRSQCAVEDLSVKFAEMQKHIGNITTQYSTFQTEVMLAIQALTHQQKQNGSVDGHGSAAPVTPRASPKPVLQSKRPARDKAEGDESPRKCVTVPSDVVVGADDDDLCIDQLDHPSDVQR